MGTIASQITSLTIVYSTVYSDADQRKYQSSTLVAICAGNSPETGEFPAQMATNAKNVSIWWRHHVQSTETIIKINSALNSCVCGIKLTFVLFYYQGLTQTRAQIINHTQFVCGMKLLIHALNSTTD